MYEIVILYKNENNISKLRWKILKYNIYEIEVTCWWKTLQNNNKPVFFTMCFSTLGNEPSVVANWVALEVYVQARNERKSKNMHNINETNATDAGNITVLFLTDL